MAGERILVVEDDTALLAGVRDILEFAGYAVNVAVNGAEALTVLEHVTPQLILSDIGMPKMDGYQLFRAVRHNPDWVSIPFVFLTAQSEKADIRRGKELGVDDYITKPFDEADLLVTVRAKLARRAQLDAAREQQFSNLKHDILTVLNHEFRTPLTYISTYANLARESGPDIGVEELKDYLRGIQAGSDRLRGLVENFLFLVELQTGEARNTYLRRREKIANLPTLLRNLLMDSTKKAVARNVRLNSEISPALPVVLGDREYLQRAVGELVDNGIKFCRREGGTVTLVARADEEHVIIDVKDDGIGLPPEELKRIFEVMVQVDRARMEQQGSGSGLSIARGIVELHEGKIQGVSQVGQGSTFTMVLPAAK